MKKWCWNCGKEIEISRRNFCSTKCMNRFADKLRVGTLKRRMSIKAHYQRHIEKCRLDRHLYYMKNRNKILARHRQNEIKRKMRLLVYDKE